MAVLLMALEGALRAFWPQDFPFFAGLFVEDPAVGMRHLPLARSRMASETAGSAAVRINSRGYRGREYPWDAAAGFRVLGLGDSFAFGFGVDEDDTYLARLERALAPRHVEVINAGLVGMGPDNEARLLAADGPGLHPDLVLVGFFVGNDLMDVLTGVARTRLRDGGLGLPIPFKGFLRRHSHAYRFLSGRVGRLREAWRRRRWITGAPGFSPFQQEAFCLRRYPPEFDLAWTRAESELRRIKSWCDTNRARLAIVAIPTRAQVYPDHWDAVRRRLNLRDEDFDLEKPQRILSAFAAGNGIPVIDVLPALRAARDTGPPLYFNTDIHWTPRGHAVAAEEILRRLRGMGLVPAS